MPAERRPRAPAPPRSAPAEPKRNAIVRVATSQFAELGYDSAKWADIAQQVGIGQTALYHYFASKAHCLFTIMADALHDHRDNFTAARRAHSDPVAVITAAIGHSFELEPAEVLRNRVLQGELGFLDKEYPGSPQEQETLAEARRYARDLTRDWMQFLQEGMTRGQLPPQNAFILAHNLLGVTSSVWEWYRPTSRIPLEELRDAVLAQALAIVFDAPDHLAAARGASG
jgi:AcrR family transcriptional regulator